MADQKLRNIALLIDADNASAQGLDAVLTALAEYGAVNIRRAYGNWTKPQLKGWIENVNKYGIETRQQFDISKGKNATDMRMTIEAMDLLHRGHVDAFGIMSSDSDFMPLVTRLKQDGLPVYGFGKMTAPEGFREACTIYLDVESLIAIAKASSISDEAKSNDVPKKIEISEDVRVLLLDAYDTSTQDPDGWAALSNIGKLASNRSSFDARNSGFKRLSDLVSAIPDFELNRGVAGDVRIRRKKSRF
jgi:uncharacterized protein (TIGR00288 family)